MGRKLFVGNLPFTATEAELNDLFSQSGSVDSVRLVTDRESGRSRGFGFVEMASDDEAERAISDMNGKEIDGRALTVNEARPQEKRDFGGSGGGRGGERRSSGGGGGGSSWSGSRY
jgi:RNA recognition motif-containing protein